LVHRCGCEDAVATKFAPDVINALLYGRLVSPWALAPFPSVAHGVLRWVGTRQGWALPAAGLLAGQP
jgi:hypothetical protein